jgi:UrcA family protein
MKRFALTILIAAQCLGGQLAHADSSSASAPHVVVRFADLDLARAEGVAALYTRLSGAAREVCAPLESRELERARRFRACVADALATAVAEVDRPLLSSYYREKLGGHAAARPQVATR